MPLSTTFYKINKIKGDGNYLFRRIACFLFSNADDYELIKKYILCMVEERFQILKAFYDEMFSEEFGIFW
jgi:hypothetical protein